MEKLTKIRAGAKENNEGKPISQFLKYRSLELLPTDISWLSPIRRSNLYSIFQCTRFVRTGLQQTTVPWLTRLRTRTAFKTFVCRFVFISIFFLPLITRINYIGREHRQNRESRQKFGSHESSSKASPAWRI